MVSIVLESIIDFTLTITDPVVKHGHGIFVLVKAAKKVCDNPLRMPMLKALPNNEKLNVVIDIAWARDRGDPPGNKASQQSTVGLCEQ